MRFKKIRYHDGNVDLEWTTPANEDGSGEITHHLKLDQEPEPEFGAAFGALTPHVIDLLGVPRKWGEDLIVYSVALSRDKNDRMGAVFSCTKPLDSFRGPLILNTPYIAEPDVDDSGPQMSSELLEVVRELERRAKRYVEGARNQGELFAPGSGSAGESAAATNGREPMIDEKVRVQERSFRIIRVSSERLEVGPWRTPAGQERKATAAIPRNGDLKWDAEIGCWTAPNVYSLNQVEQPARAAAE